VTIHRAYGHVDRAAVREGGPLRVVMCSEGRQADGIDLRMSGADLARFRANPVLGYGHAYFGRANLPIGRVAPDSITTDGSRLRGDLEFDQADEFARTVERKLRDGYLSAVSIGFEVHEWEGDGSYWKGGVATAWSLHELSVVPVPMDASATVESGRSGMLPYDPEFARAFLAAMEAARRAFAPVAEATTSPPLPSWIVGERGPELVEPPDPSTKDTPEPAPEAGSSVPSEAARALLAAFPKGVTE
jgi:HK97 family phage prohead protease